MTSSYQIALLIFDLGDPTLPTQFDGYDLSYWCILFRAIYILLLANQLSFSTLNSRINIGEVKTSKKVEDDTFLKLMEDFIGRSKKLSTDFSR